MPRIPHLQPRQEQALWLLAGGMSNREIAETMGISVRTVEIQLDSVRKAFALHSRGALMAFVLTTDWQPSARSIAPDRDRRIASTIVFFRKRIETITGDIDWRHPNLAAAADRLRKTEEDLLLWSRNQRLADETPHELIADAERVDAREHNEMPERAS